MSVKTANQFKLLDVDRSGVLDRRDVGRDGKPLLDQLSAACKQVKPSYSQAAFDAFVRQTSAPAMIAIRDEAAERTLEHDKETRLDFVDVLERIGWFLIAPFGLVAAPFVAALGWWLLLFSPQAYGDMVAGIAFGGWKKAFEAVPVSGRVAAAEDLARDLSADCREAALAPAEPHEPAAPNPEGFLVDELHGYASDMYRRHELDANRNGRVDGADRAKLDQLVRALPAGQDKLLAEEIRATIDDAFVTPFHDAQYRHNHGAIRDNRKVLERFMKSPALNEPELLRMLTFLPTHQRAPLLASVSNPTALLTAMAAREDARRHVVAEAFARIQLPQVNDVTTFVDVAMQMPLDAAALYDILSTVKQKRGEQAALRFADELFARGGSEQRIADAVHALYRGQPPR